MRIDLFSVYFSTFTAQYSCRYTWSTVLFVGHFVPIIYASLPFIFDYYTKKSVCVFTIIIFLFGFFSRLQIKKDQCVREEHYIVK